MNLREHSERSSCLIGVTRFHVLPAFKSLNMLAAVALPRLFDLTQTAVRYTPPLKALRYHWNYLMLCVFGSTETPGLSNSYTRGSPC